MDTSDRGWLTGKLIPGRRPLKSHSNDIWKLLVPRTHNKLGNRSFSAAGPRLWNDLPPGLRSRYFPSILLDDL